MQINKALSVEVLICFKYTAKSSKCIKLKCINQGHIHIQIVATLHKYLSIYNLNNFVEKSHDKTENNTFLKIKKKDSYV